LGLVKKQTRTRTFIYLISLLMTAFTVTACSSPAGKAVEDEGFAMGTVITQKVYGANGKTATAEAMQRLEYLDKLLTFNAPEGDVYALNINAGKGEVNLNPITLKILNKAQQVAELSNGAFDVTVGPLVKSWGIGTEQQHVPAAEEIHNLLALVNYKDLYLNGQSAGLKKVGQMVDLGGIAKGYAGDEVVQIYKKHGIDSGFVNIGGNVVTLGSKPDGSPWTVGIRNPRPQEGVSGQQIVGTVTVNNKAVVTAGDDQRYFEQDGKRYHHILDPHTGYPAESDLMSVTLITDSSFDADALDTAVFILGLEKGKELLRKYGGIEAVFITKDKKIYVTDGLKSNFQLHDESHEYQYIE